MTPGTAGTVGVGIVGIGIVGAAGSGTVGTVGTGTVGTETVGAVGIPGTVGAVGAVGAVGTPGAAETFDDPPGTEFATGTPVLLVVVVSLGFPDRRAATTAKVPSTMITTVRPDQNCAPAPRRPRWVLAFCGGRAGLFRGFAMTEGEISR